MDYYSFYYIADGKLEKEKNNCEILEVEFIFWSPGCNKPRSAVLKVIQKDTKYSETELKHLVYASRLHTGFLQIYHFFEDFANVYIFMEYCQNGSLKNYQEMKMLNARWTDLQLLHRMHEIVKPLMKLHVSGIAHRDLKLENIFVTVDGTLKLSDFGLSRKVEQNQLSQTYGGTQAYMSPQLSKKVAVEKLQNDKDDIWAVGVTFYKLATVDNLHPDIASLSEIGIQNAISKLTCSGRIKKIICMCLVWNYEDRINTRGLLKEIKNAICEEFPNTHAIQYQYRCMLQEFSHKNYMKVLELEKKCMICKQKSGNLSNFRFVHYAHIACLLEKNDGFSSFTCPVCGIFDTEHVQSEIEGISNNLLKHHQCDIKSRSDSFTNHAFLALNEHFSSQILQCEITKNTFCSLCSDKTLHLHCIGLQKFFNSWKSSVLMFSSEQKMIFLQDYSNWDFGGTINTGFDKEYILKKIPFDSITPIAVYLHSIACLISENVLFLHYWYLKNREILMFFEYASKSTLKQDLLRRHNLKVKFTFEEIRKILRSISNVLLDLHKHHIYHNAISLSHIYMTKSSNLKLTHFNNASFHLSRNFLLEKKDIQDFSEIIIKIAENSVDPKNPKIQKFVESCSNYSESSDFLKILTEVIQ